MNSLEICGLSKTYQTPRGAIKALVSLSFDVMAGEVFAVLGPNGAGKTTLTKLLLGIIQPTAGECRVLGEPAGSIRAKQSIGYLPEQHAFPPHLSGRQFLSIFGALSGLRGILLQSRIEEALEVVDMARWGTTSIGRYSKGMMQRIGLAQALLTKPPVLMLDEPTDGIDPVGRKEIRDIIRRVKEAGTTVFLNSHLLSEVEYMSDRVAILQQGTLRALGTINELTGDTGIYEITVETLPENAAHDLLQISGVTLLTGNLPGFTLHAPTSQTLNHCIDELRRQGIVIIGIIPKKTTLEEVFLSYVAEPKVEL